MTLEQLLFRIKYRINAIANTVIRKVVSLTLSGKVLLIQVAEDSYLYDFNSNGELSEPDILTSFELTQLRGLLG